ncbi:MAG: hypothetical protein JXQ71_12175, partial [Verrucomicrobia bacterium]|nr:hypothetical protein [Verrucomicrobiota bacterium]
WSTTCSLEAQSAEADLVFFSCPPRNPGHVVLSFEFGICFGFRISDFRFEGIAAMLHERSRSSSPQMA